MTLATPRALSTELTPPNPTNLKTHEQAIQALIAILAYLRQTEGKLEADRTDIDTLLAAITLTQTVSVVHKTADYTMNPGDCVVIGDATGGDITITLPKAQTVAGRVFYVKKIDSSANLVRIEGYSAETIDDAANANMTVQYESVTVASDGVEWWVTA